MQVLYRLEEIRALERRARAHLAPGTLMRRAGEAAARIVDDRLRDAGHPGGSVLLLCGPGDNGGDGFATALELAALGYACRCWAPLASGSADALAARTRWQAAGGALLAQLPGTEPPHLVVDALLGIGATRGLDGPLLAALRWTQEHRLPLVALDVPSGLDADTGMWMGGIAGAAALDTVTFIGDKPGLHLREGLVAAGRIHVAPLDPGVHAAADPVAGRLNGPDCFAALCGPRPRDANKGSFGTVSVVGGARGMVGAALLAGRAALRLGAGKVFVDVLGAPDLAWDPAQPELMLRAGRIASAGDVLLAGCGMGTDAAAHAVLRAALVHTGPVVLDADALNGLAADAGLRAALPAGHGVRVLTPHPGEAARLLGVTTDTVQRDRVACARRLAADGRCVAVLKGAGTVIADPAGDYVINGTGGPALASAGTGDVLAGMLAALLAQGADALTAACGAVWLHGRAADLHGGDIGLVASDLPVLAARALAQLRDGSTALRPANR